MDTQGRPRTLDTQEPRPTIAIHKGGPREANPADTTLKAYRHLYLIKNNILVLFNNHNDRVPLQLNRLLTFHHVPFSRHSY